MPLASSMIGTGQSCPAAVDLEVARSHLGAVARRGSAPRPGERGENPSTSSSVVSRRSETRTLPCVSAPIAARTWLGSSVDAVQAEPLATANPRRSRPSTQRLAVDVEARERHQVRAAGRPGRRRPRCRGSPATAGRIRSTSACWRAVTSSRSATHRLQRGGGGEGGRDVLEPVPLVDAVVAGERVAPSGRPCVRRARRRRPARPTCAPTRPRPTSRRAGGAGPPRRRRRRTAARRPGSVELGHRLDGADLVVGRLERDDAAPGRRAAREDVHVDPAEASTADRGLSRRLPGHRVQHRRVLDGGVRPRPAPSAPVHQPQQAAVHGVGARGGERRPRRGARRGTRRPPRARCRAAAGRCAPGRCSRRGSA